MEECNYSPIPNFDSGLSKPLEVRAWMSNHILHKINDMITYT